jgi:hypothetical protein
MVVNDAELAQARTDMSTQLFHDVAVVQRRTRPSDNAGGISAEVYSALWTGFGKVAPSSASEAEHAMRLHHDESVTISLPITSQVASDDRVVIGGQTFEVFGVLTPRTWDIVRRVLAVEVG